MQIIESPKAMQEAACNLRKEGRKIGLVPTMGSLHEAHLSLIRIARQCSDIVVVSIFVNPTQFGPDEDFEAYPRNVEKDRQACGDENVDVIFCPSVEDMYDTDHSVYVNEEYITLELEGVSRPGHFKGVATVVAKLFNSVLPDIAVFGEKDYQQLRLIQQMVADLNFPVKIIAGPTTREPDGLAMSSRNIHLEGQEREKALCLRRALDHAEKLYQEGERNAEVIKQAVRDSIASVSGAELDYVELVKQDTFEPAKALVASCRLLLAVHIGSVRLLDNTVLADRRTQTH